jgi:hypothetical protein
MPIYPVKLYEGNELVTYEVNASSPEEAKAKALEARERFFQEETTRAGLEQEKAQIEQQLSSQKGSFGAALEGAGVGFDHAVRGVVIDTALNAAEGVTGLFASGGNVGAMRTFEKIQEMRRNNIEGGVRVATRANEAVAGREMTQSEKARQLEDTATFVKRGKFAGDLGLGVAGGAATMAARSVPRMLALGATEGGLGGFLMADTTGQSDWSEANKDRLEQATLGAVLGTGLSVAPSILVGIKNWMGRSIQKAAGGKKALDAARGALNRLGIHEVTPYQLSGDPRIGAVERETAGQGAQQMFQRQMNQSVGAVARQADVNLPPTQDLLEGGKAAIEDVFDTARFSLGKMRGDRNKAFQKAMNEIVEETGGVPNIPVGSFMDSLNATIKTLGEDYGTSVKFSSLFKDTVAELEAVMKTGGVINAKRANIILTRLNGIQQTGRGLFDTTQDMIVGNEGKFLGHAKIIAKDLKTQFLGVLDDAAENMGGTAGAHLKQARNQYGAQSNQIRAFEDAWKDSVGLSGTPASILKRLETADTAQARTFVEGLRKMHGGQEVIDQMNKHLIQSAVRKASHAKVGQGLAAGEFDLQVFLKELSATRQSSRLKGLLLPEQEANMVKGMRSLERLLNSEQLQQGVMRTRIPVDLQHLAINAISRDPGFMARVLGGAIQSGEGAEALFFTKAGQDILFDAVNFSLRAPKTGAAIQSANATVAYLTSMIGSGEQLREIWRTMQSEEVEQQQQ